MVESPTFVAKPFNVQHKFHTSVPAEGVLTVRLAHGYRSFPGGFDGIRGRGPSRLEWREDPYFGLRMNVLGLHTWNSAQ
jgi:hypothetical protein